MNGVIHTSPPITNAFSSRGILLALGAALIIWVFKGSLSISVGAAIVMAMLYSQYNDVIKKNVSPWLFWGMMGLYFVPGTLIITVIPTPTSLVTGVFYWLCVLSAGLMMILSLFMAPEFREGVGVLTLAQLILYGEIWFVVVLLAWVIPLMSGYIMPIVEPARPVIDPVIGFFDKVLIAIRTFGQ